MSLFLTEKKESILFLIKQKTFVQKSKKGTVRQCLKSFYFR